MHFGRHSINVLINFLKGQLLGFTKYIPPYATASGPTILKGVNYASGGAGIRNETGQNVVISFIYITVNM